jgi:hypothetical protein
MLNDFLSPKKESCLSGDFDDDTIPEMMVKFSWRDVFPIHPPYVDIVELRVTGRLKNGIPFEGQGSLKINDKKPH